MKFIYYHPNMTILLIGLGVTLAINGVTMSLVERAFHAPGLAAHHFREPIPTRATDAEKRRLFALNSALSLAILFGSAVLLFPRLFTVAPAGIGRVLFQALAILLIYDGLYYALHRFAFHHRRLMRYVHGLHHSARTPSARESLYTHPVEVALGLSLFLFSTWLVGPVSVPAFLIANVVYSQMNILIHSGIAFPSGPMRLFNLWARAHHGHHGVDMNKNFASLSPIWDALFGTSV